ncbi:matrix metalloproteinase-19-like [Mytilus trossulus]|uniref:matrix metalloproteinase-19-like n=1 Tax=Mytilus trossulus TaxID=6551 RepID=UPI003004F60D
MKLLILFQIFFLLIQGQHVKRFTRSTDKTNVNDFLQKFGYMPRLRSLKTSNTSDESTSYALRTFQEYNHLPVTGELDDKTVKLMNTPRCGMQDKPTPHGMPLAFSAGNGDWGKKVLTYKISKGSTKVTAVIIRENIAKSVAVWTSVADITITEVTGAASADIDIRFEFGAHGDGFPFDGPGGIVTHAWYPPDGRLHFDDAEAWDVGGNGADLFPICAHAIGHILGLGHSNVPGSMMYPWDPATGNPAGVLSPDDLAGIRSSFGTTPGTVTQNLLDANDLQSRPAGLVGKPAVCYMSFQAATKSPAMDMTIAFVEDVYVLVIDDDVGLRRITRTESIFSGIFYNPDAAFTNPKTSYTYFIKGKYVYEFDYNLDPVSRNMITDDFPEDPHASFARSENEIYIFGATKVWKFDLQKKSVVPGSEALIKDAFRGVPDDIDAAIYDKPNTVYFFKELSYYVYDLETNRVTEGGPEYDAPATFLQDKCISDDQ